MKENYKEKYIEKERRDNDGSFQICGKTRLLVRVENTDGSLKNLTFNNIRESASDEELLHAGKAIAGLQVKALDSVRRSDVAVLTDGE